MRLNHIVSLIITHLVRVFRRIRYKGFFEAYSFFRHEYLFDSKRHHIETRYVADLKYLDVKNYQGCHAYMGVSETTFAAACRQLPGEVKWRYEFVDVGSGKGRALILAHEHGFIDIVGYEISSWLNTRCRKNLERLHLTDKIHLHECNILDAVYNVKNKVVFLYNPFDKSLFEDFIESLTSFLKKNELDAYIIYVNQVHEGVLLQHRYIKLAEHQSDANRSYVVYRLGDDK